MPTSVASPASSAVGPEAPASDALFVLGDDAGVPVLEPQPIARSGWGDQIRGNAVSGALARATELEMRDLGRAELQLARWSVRLFRAARMTRSTTTSRVVRQGPRVCLVDAVLEQNGVPVARSSALYLRPSPTPPEEVWSRDPIDLAPPPDVVPVKPEFRLYHTDVAGWTSTGEEHQNAEPKRTWHLPMRLVEGETPTPLQFLAGVADVTNMVTNWGSEGVQFINVDVDLALARFPGSGGVGLVADQRLVGDGIVVGSAVVFDRDGALGLASVTAVANARRSVDVARDWSPNGIRAVGSRVPHDAAGGAGSAGRPA